MAITCKESTSIEANGLRALSSTRDDAWHAERNAGAYEWWYFDALSDDGRETLVIIFMDGFVFSPRYNRAVKEHLRQAHLSAPRPTDFPAIAISLYRDGRLIERSIHEYSSSEFAARLDHPECRIGSNHFALTKDANEITYKVQLNAPLRRGRRLVASLSWKVKEGNFSRHDKESGEANSIDNVSAKISAHVWNLVAPRCKVDGTISILDSRGALCDERQWTGTGYHDHNRDSRWMPATIDGWQWGRAHFADATLIFYRYREQHEANFKTRLYVVRDSVLKTYMPEFAATKWRRHFFGLRYPRALQLRVNESNANLNLFVEQRRIIDSSFFYLRFAGEATVDFGDGFIWRAPIITEQLAPRALRWRALWWLTNMRIGYGERASFLP